MVEGINKADRPMPPADQRRLVSTYDAGILAMDRSFDVLVAELRQRGAEPGVYGRGLTPASSRSRL